MRTSDAAWRAILRARGAVQGKVFFMTRGTMWTIQSERDQEWNPLATYHLYCIAVHYDDRMPFGHITLEEP